MIYCLTPQQAIAAAANIPTGDNPEYTIEDFRRSMPAFTQQVIADENLQPYVDMAQAMVRESRWRSLWRQGMALFIAHFVTLFLDVPAEGASAEEIVSSAKSGGLISSESTGGVSVSYDHSTAASDLNGWGAWKLTTYGIQYVTLARMVGMGMMIVR